MTKHTFLTLDGLRGIAALAVVAMHYSEPFEGSFARNAYLAVDLFFIMSGFVIAHAYEAKIIGGLSFSRFFLMRLIRLYPMYIAGSMLTAAGIGAALLIGMAFDSWNWSVLAQATMPALFMLPAPRWIGELYPLNFPAWSLFYEFIANVIFALILARRPTAVIAMVALTSGAALTSIALTGGAISTGPSWDGVGTSLLRVMFGFAVGQWIYRTTTAQRRPPWIPAWLILVGVAILLLLPIESRVFAAVMPLLLLPLIALAAVHTEPSDRQAPMFKFLAAISYPIYVIHIPLLFLSRRALDHVSGLQLEQDPLLCLALALVAVALAWGADRYFDLPVRRRLMAILIARRATLN